MKTLYLECQMGAAGDMMTAALLDLFDNPHAIIQSFNQWGLPGVEYRLEDAESYGIHGRRIRVCVNGEEEETHDCHDFDHHDHCHHEDHDHCHHEDHDHCHCDAHDHCHHHENDLSHDHCHHHHEHHTLAEIQQLVERLSVDSCVKKDIMAVYRLLAEAESEAHGEPVEQIHFHEVGCIDAVADITAVCYLIHLIHPDRIVSSPIHVGSGHVHCAHGILPVPAPATACILRGVPCYGGSVPGELCTPTGAALIKHFASSYESLPMMSVSHIGYGMGHKTFKRPNFLRVFTGDEDDVSDKIVEFKCNLDDMTPESLAFAQERLFEAGAVEVFVTSVVMKKSRSGFVLTVDAPISLKQIILKTIFKYTTTIGVREYICQRYVLQRNTETVSIDNYGDVRIKKSSGYGVERQKYEYEDLARIARENDLALDDVKKRIVHCEGELKG